MKKENSNKFKEKLKNKYVLICYKLYRVNYYDIFIFIIIIHENIRCLKLKFYLLNYIFFCTNQNKK